MMCSNWKISVFGILALILAFGLVTTDALAQLPDPPNVRIAAIATTGETGNIDNLRAADTATITFTVTILPHTDEDKRKAGQVRIIIPNDWSSPLDSIGPVVSAVREIAITDLIGSDGAGADDDATGSFNGRHLIVDIGKAASGDVVFEFMTVTPPTMRTHGFELRSTVHAIVDDALACTDPVDEDQIRKRGSRYYLDIDVGPIRSGANPDNNFTLSGGGNLHLQPNPPMRRCNRRPTRGNTLLLVKPRSPICWFLIRFRVPCLKIPSLS